MAFEYGVILNGSQTKANVFSLESWFEYGVILNGSQKYSTRMETIKGFEYGVEYGVILRKPEFNRAFLLSFTLRLTSFRNFLANNRAYLGSKNEYRLQNVALNPRGKYCLTPPK